MAATEKRVPGRREGVALTLAIASLLPCLWFLGPIAYFVAEKSGGGRARAARVIALIGSTFLLLFFLYAVAYAAGTIASPR